MPGRRSPLATGLLRSKPSIALHRARFETRVVVVEIFSGVASKLCLEILPEQTHRRERDRVFLRHRHRTTARRRDRFALPTFVPSAPGNVAKKLSKLRFS